MELIVQIKSFCLSFMMGIFFSFMFNLCYKYLFTKYVIINVISNMFFSMLIFGVYFFLLCQVNNGIIHLYFILIFFIGFYLYNKIFVKLRVK